MGRINLDALRKIEEARNKKYVWCKPLVLCGKVFPQAIRFTLPQTVMIEHISKEGGEKDVSKTV